MGQIRISVPLGDVRDVAAFVNAAIRDGWPWGLSTDERDELEAEGLLIMCELFRDYRVIGPRSRFSGYAAMLLTGRLRTAWHVFHRGEHVRGRDINGHCVWQMRPRIGSLDAELASPAFSEQRMRQMIRFERPPAPSARVPA